MPDNKLKSLGAHLKNLYNLYSGATLMKYFGAEKTRLSLWRNVFGPIYLAAGPVIGTAALIQGNPDAAAASLAAVWAIGTAAMNAIGLVEVGADRIYKKIENLKQSTEPNTPAAP